MTHAGSRIFRRFLGMAALCVTVLGFLAPAAHARVFVGVGVPLPFFGPPVYYPPPIYYPPPPPPYYYAPPPPPPYYYAPPPPVVYTPPQAAPGYGGQSCNAGSYVCPMERPVAPGSGCYCVGNGGQRIRGNAN